jgi:hypothetical protein
MATVTETSGAPTIVTPSHDYHAEAHVLSGHLKRPIEQKIDDQAPVLLNDRRGGHLTRCVDDFSLEGFISFTKGETRVSGARSIKTNGWVTLSTAIVEGLNLFEIVTADGIVSQVSTEHPYIDGHVPQVTFLGTQFKNLQVGGFPVPLKLNLGFCGDRPAGGRSYLQDPNFLEKVRAQTAAIAGARGLPNPLKEQYDKRLAYIQQLISICDEGDQGSRDPITCSLVESIGEIPIPGVKSFGHLLVIPEFGSLALGEVEVGQKEYEGTLRGCVYFTLHSLRTKMGCVSDGENDGPSATANGHTEP